MMKDMYKTAYTDILYLTYVYIVGSNVLTKQ